MVNQNAYQLGENRSCIRDLFEYGRQRAAIVGEEKVYDYSLGNPSIPSPAAVDEAVRQILLDTPTLQIHGYTSAVGDLATRRAIADDLNQRYNAGCREENCWPSPPISRNISPSRRKRACASRWCLRTYRTSRSSWRLWSPCSRSIPRRCW